MPINLWQHTKIYKLIYHKWKKQCGQTKKICHSPTPCTEAIRHTLIVDAQEERDVAILDLPAQFLKKETDGVLYLKFGSSLALLY